MAEETKQESKNEQGWIEGVRDLPVSLKLFLEENYNRNRFIDNVSIGLTTLDRIQFQIYMSFWSERLDFIKAKYPVDWYEAFRERWFPDFIIEDHPIKYKGQPFAMVVYPDLEIETGYRFYIPAREPRDLKEIGLIFRLTPPSNILELGDLLNAYLLYHIRQSIEGEISSDRQPRIIKVKHHLDWWQSFKARWFPGRALKHYPVKFVTQTFDASEFCSDYEPAIAGQRYIIQIREV